MPNRIIRLPTVLDRTGLPGRFDFTLKWSRDDPPPTEADAPPPLFTALQEQLGLRLRLAKGAIEMIVIDHVEQPSDN